MEEIRNMPYLRHQKRELKYTLIQRSLTQKNIVIRVRQGEVVVSAPKTVSVKKVEEVLKEKWKWIFEKLSESSQIKPKSALTVNDMIFFVGQPLRIELLNEHIVGQKIVKTRFALQIPTHLIEHVSIEQVVQTWLRHQAECMIPKMVIELAQTFQLTPLRIRVKEQRSRWGSCSSRGSIQINWRLIQAPAKILEYVIIHELAHLTYLNHSSAFWDLVARMMPDYHTHREWLKTNGASLFRIDT